MEMNVKVFEEFLKEYGYTTSESALSKIYRTWEVNKANILAHFRKHPNWDEENLAIVFKDEEYERTFEADALETFYDWCLIRVNEIEKNHALDLNDMYDDVTRLEKIYNHLYYVGKEVKELNKDYFEGVVLNKEIITVYGEYEKLKNEYRSLKQGRTKHNGIYVEDDIYNKTRKFLDAMSYIVRNCRSQFISASDATWISSKADISVNEGLKLTKAILKLCKTIGIDKYVEMKERNNSGEMKNYGFDYQFQLMADKINPVKYKRITVISVNPLDYWGMSFGYKWASCMTIDKKNIRGITSNHYSGCYSGGTESYMLDGSTVVYYVIDEDYNGNCYWSQDKMQRVLFMINENGTAILESRVYPDGRDGGDEGIAGQFRTVMQKVISDLYDVNNMWTLKKGSYDVSGYTASIGSQYTDYTHYDDVNISLQRNVDIPLIRIGHKTICPCCGVEHTYEENILCDDCAESGRDMRTCEECDDDFDMNEANYVHTSDDRYFCCEDCARNAGYRYCDQNDEWEDEDLLVYTENDGWCFEEDCFKDDYTGDWYYGDPEVTTEDGNNYWSTDNAMDDGYVETNDGYWYQEDECVEIDEYWYNKDDCVEMDDGTWFRDEYDAEEAGYVLTEDNYWILEKDAINVEVDGLYFKTENKAIEAGYIETFDGYWVKKELVPIHTIDDKYFVTIESAIANGYHETEEGWCVA